MTKQFAIRCLAAGLLTAYAFTPSTTYAQGSNLFGNAGGGMARGGTGGITGGLTGTGFSGTGGAAGAATSGFGGASMAGAFGGQSASPFGGAGRTGMGGMGGAMGTTGGFGGAMGNTTGMVGRTNTGFAGNARAGQTGMGNTGSGATRNFGNTGGSQRGNNFSQNTKPERTTSSVRPLQRVAFEYNAKSPQTLATKAGTRIEKIGLKNPALQGVQVTVDGDKLVLTGKVKNAEQSRLAANLLRLEPGVRSIRNDLELEQPATE